MLAFLTYWGFFVFKRQSGLEAQDNKTRLKSLLSKDALRFALKAGEFFFFFCPLHVISYVTSAPGAFNIYINHKSLQQEVQRHRVMSHPSGQRGQKKFRYGIFYLTYDICSSSSLLCLLNKFKATQQPCIKSCLQKMNNVQRFSFPTYNLRKLLNSGGVSGLQPRLNSNGMCRRIETLLQQCNIWSNNLVRHNANRN